MIDYSSLANSQDPYSTALIDSLPLTPWTAPIALVIVKPKRTRKTAEQVAAQHRASQAAYKAGVRLAAKLKKAALGVNTYIEVPTAAQKQAGKDKSRAIQSASNRYRTA